MAAPRLLARSQGCERERWPFWSAPMRAGPLCRAPYAESGRAKPGSVGEKARPQRAAIGIAGREDRADILADAEETLPPVADMAAAGTAGERQPDQRRGNSLLPPQHRNLHHQWPRLGEPQPIR